MARACTKCRTEIPDGAQLDMQAEKYPCCPKCWAEWKEYRVMVINEMRLDLSMPDHRKVLRKNEKIFVGVLAPDGTAVDYTNEDNRRPDEPGAGAGGAEEGAGSSDPPPGQPAP